MNNREILVYSNTVNSLKILKEHFKKESIEVSPFNSNLTLQSYSNFNNIMTLSISEYFRIGKNHYTVTEDSLFESFITDSMREEILNKNCNEIENFITLMVFLPNQDYKRIHLSKKYKISKESLENINDIKYLYELINIKKDSIDNFEAIKDLLVIIENNRAFQKLYDL